MANIVCLFVLVIMVFSSSCSKRERVILIDHTDRISSLEERLALNEQLDSARDTLISLNLSSIEQLQSDLLTLESDLLSLLEQERLAREAGDLQNAQALATSVAIQSFINGLVQSQIANLRFRINSNLTRIFNLQSAIDDLESEVSSIQDDISDLQGEVSDLQDQLDSIDLIALEDSIMEQVQDLIDASISPSVTVIKPCPSASEVLFKIDGVLYGAMNHRQGNGNGANLNSVALEPLNNGTYSSTSGSGNCTFTVNNGNVL
jgi:hypothetical protein